MTSSAPESPSCIDAEIIPIGVLPDADPGVAIALRVTPGRLVGRGATGAVYEAHDHSLNRTIALKALLPDSPIDARTFLDEAARASHITHPHLLPIFGIGTLDGAPAFAMPFVTGGSLAETTDRIGRLDPRTVAQVGRQVASALDALHAVGLIHCDVKPANVLLHDTGDAHPHSYLTDFGAGLSLHQASSGGQHLQPIGTLGFAAPEQLDGRPCDARTDVYGLAATIYYALTGEVPVATTDGHVALTDARPDLDPELNLALGRALAIDPTQRYASAGSAAEAIAEPLGRGTRPTLIGPSLRVTTPTPGRRHRRRDDGDGHGPGRRSIVIAIALAVILALIGIALLMRPSGHSRAPISSEPSSSAPVGSTIPLPTGAPNLTPTERDLLRSIPTALQAQCRSASAYNAQAALTCIDTRAAISTTYWQFADQRGLEQWFIQYSASFPSTGGGTCADGRSADTTWRARTSDPTPAGRLRCSTMPGFSTIMWTTDEQRIFAAANTKSDLVTLWKWWQTTPGPVKP